MVIDRTKWSNTPNEAMPVETMNKNPYSFLKISSLQEDAPPSYKLQDQKYEKLLQSIEYFKFVSHKARISWEFDWKKDSQIRTRTSNIGKGKC